jgi:hypothetical protein
MPTYVLLVDWTSQGAQAVEQTVERLEAGSQLAESFGCKLEHVWWTQGGHDMVSVVNAPDLPGAPTRCARSWAGYRSRGAGAGAPPRGFEPRLWESGVGCVPRPLVRDPAR